MVATFGTNFDYLVFSVYGVLSYEVGILYSSQGKCPGCKCPWGKCLDGICPRGGSCHFSTSSTLVV